MALKQNKLKGIKKMKDIINKEWDKIFYQFEDNNFSNYAFPLFLFTKRLYDELKNSNKKTVLFMSREGQFLKKLFDTYCSLKKEKDIKTYYFYGSRNSVMSAALKPLNEEDFKFLFRFFRFFIKPVQFLTSIGLSDQQVEEVKKSFGKKAEKRCFNFAKSKSFEKLKQDPVFQKCYDENRNYQSKAFASYLKTFNINYVSDGLTFVDIGYHGTMQDLIFSFLGEKVNIMGYYIKNRTKSDCLNAKFGLLSDAEKKVFGGKITKYDAYHYEQILRANHGRCLGYELQKDGTAKAVLDAKHDDKQIFEKYVEKMQNEIFEKFKLIFNESVKSDLNVENICIIYYYQMIKNKTKQDKTWILNMQDCHHDDFGYVGYPGRAFKRGLRNFAFTLKDKLFVFNKSCYVKKLKKNLKKGK